MDINKLSSVNNNNVNRTSEGSSSSKKTSKATDAQPTDKITLGDYQFRNNDQLFAKLELEKLNEYSSKRLQEIQTQVKAFQQAAEVSPEAAEQTEMGQKINNPSVWEDIAHKILQ